MGDLAAFIAFISFLIAISGNVLSTIVSIGAARSERKEARRRERIDRLVDALNEFKTAYAGFSASRSAGLSGVPKGVFQTNRYFAILRATLLAAGDDELRTIAENHLSGFLNTEKWQDFTNGINAALIRFGELIAEASK